MSAGAARSARINALETRTYRIATDLPEADGTLAWDSTTALVVLAHTEDGPSGIGYSYTSAAAARVVDDLLAPGVVGKSTDLHGELCAAMVRATRNVGVPGIAANAISAVDVALWDLRGRESETPLYRLLSSSRDAVPIYGSGGFTSYSLEQLTGQLRGWVAAGIPRVKMKIGKDAGTRPREDLERVAAARDAIGPDTQLFVDANGAYTASQAIDQARELARSGVSYFEEPVSSDRLRQMRFVRDHAPMAIAAGEYGYTPWYFHEMLRAGAVDILQADATRCLGVTGFLNAGAQAYAAGVPFSAHTAPTIHAHAGCGVPRIEHVEYFHDHVRVERMLFDGVLQPDGGYLHPDPHRPGLGIELRKEAEQWRLQ